jgi:hypothetical protein
MHAGIDFWLYFSTYECYFQALIMVESRPGGSMTLNDDDDQPPADGGPAEAAHYIKGAVHDLACLARRHRLEMLAYLLDMAHLEAEERLRLRGR